MSGSTIGTIIFVIIVAAILIAIGVWLMNWLYRRSSKETSFVRTGLGGQRVVMNGGAFVLPVLHEATPVTAGKRYAFLPFLYDEAARLVREKNFPHVAVGQNEDNVAAPGNPEPSCEGEEGAEL